MFPLSRRDFLLQSGSCAAHPALASLTMPAAARSLWARGSGREIPEAVIPIATSHWSLTIQASCSVAIYFGTRCFQTSAMLDEVERAARKAHAAGTSPADAASAFTLPATLGEWTMFNKIFYQRAFEAWYKELAKS